MNILALDTGTLTGWATSNGHCGVWNFSGHDRAVAWDLLRRRVNSAFAAMPLDNRMLSYEKTVHRGAGSVKLSGFICFAEYAAWQMGAKIFHAHNASIKKHATGNGHASKVQMMQAADCLGWSPENEHEADALWLLDYTRHQLAKLGD